MINVPRNNRLPKAMRRARGFTLVELAIVLAVAGLLFVGLWRLLSSGNQQVRDQSAASQMEQLISSTKSYLASSVGQAFLAPLPANTTVNLPIGNLASYLPAGFGAGTVNSYGQTYYIQLLTGASAATYSFMIITMNGDVIPDTSGGRISAFIGNDGGFIYSTNVCGAPANQMACGAYGAWAVNATAAGPAGYGIPAGNVASGHIAARTFVSPTGDSTMPWLERNLSLQPDPTFNWNTMGADLYMGTTAGHAGFSNIYLAPFGTAAGGSTINMEGGMISIEGGTISGTGASTINMVGAGSGAVNSQILSNSGCTRATPAPGDPCPWSISVIGDQSVSNMLLANVFYANTFIYQNSDIRVKTNVHPIMDALDDIMKLKPVAFTLKANGKDSFGVIAQDLEKVYPQLVTEGPGVKAVNYDGLIGPLIGAVQELKQENDELRQKLDAQQKRENQLEKDLRASKGGSP